MAWENRYPNQRGYGQQGGYNRSYGQRDNLQRRKKEPPAEIKPLPLPVDYVDEAERVMRAVLNEEECVSTSKIRVFLMLINEVYNVEKFRTERELASESKIKLLRLRVRMVYDAGREKTVASFLKQAKLLEYLKGIGDNREATIHFSHYVEALVAYHRYLGGSEN